MKTKKLFGILSLLIIIGVTSCNSDTPQDNVENIKMKVSSEIGTYQLGEVIISLIVCW